ncbi:MAG TPA: GTP cyclohydrolase IIa, partial [Desulfurococcaceae archaeon]|nr:GTP cyclohydrolase IIa [Desulfurococcaceae archaeon]
MKIGVLKLEGYREWTESIGFDREWIIQTIQAN